MAQWVIQASHVRVDCGNFFCERLKAARCCRFDWHGRLTQKGWFAFSLAWRLASLPGCFNTVKHTATHTVIETVKHYHAVSAQGSTLYVSEAHDWQSVHDKETVKELHWKWTQKSQIFAVNTLLIVNTSWSVNSRVLFPQCVSKHFSKTFAWGCSDCDLFIKDKCLIGSVKPRYRCASWCYTFMLLPVVWMYTLIPRNVLYITIMLVIWWQIWTPLTLALSTHTDTHTDTVSKHSPIMRWMEAVSLSRHGSFSYLHPAVLISLCPCYGSCWEKVTYTKEKNAFHLFTKYFCTVSATG